jgi:glutathione reductase (NADPH)
MRVLQFSSTYYYYYTSFFLLLSHKFSIPSNTKYHCRFYTAQAFSSTSTLPLLQFRISSPFIESVRSTTTRNNLHRNQYFTTLPSHSTSRSHIISVSAARTFTLPSLPIPKWRHPFNSLFLNTIRSSNNNPGSTITSTTRTMSSQTDTDNTTYDYDLVVIGGGSGGVRASRISAGYGAKTLLIESQLKHGIPPYYAAIGGTCVNVGCVPKKLMVFASRYPNEVHHAKGYGWKDATIGGNDHNDTPPKFDWNAFMETKNAEITRLNNVYTNNILGSAGVEIVEGLGRLKDEHTIDIVHSMTGEVIKAVTAKNIVVATGGWPFKPDDVPGAEEYSITSNEIFYLPEQPKHIVVVGGGFIAVEFACIMAGLGSQVTLMYRGDLFLRGFDDDMRNHIKEEILRNTKIDLQFNTAPTEITKNEDGSLLVKTNTNQSVACDTVLMATGRKGKVDGLNLESAGVHYDKGKGVIPVDSYSKTNIPHIYAVGDVTGRIALTPVALMEGHSLADTLYGGMDRPVDHRMVASTVFTTPEIGTVGYTEAEAAKKFRDIKVYLNRFRPMKHAFPNSNSYALFKLIVDSKTDKVLGCHIATDNAGDMIQGIAICLKMGATKADFDTTIGIHPTSAEELVTMRTPSYQYVDGVKVEEKA